MTMIRDTGDPITTLTITILKMLGAFSSCQKERMGGYCASLVRPECTVVTFFTGQAGLN